MAGAMGVQHVRLAAHASLTACAVVAAAAAGFGGAGGPSALSDDFNDNAIGALWDSFSTHPQLMVASEQNQRLAFPANAAGAAPGCCLVAASGLAARDWALDWTQDFRLRITFHIDLPSLPPPEQPAANVSLDLGFTTDGARILEGVRFVFGSVIQEPNILLSPAVRMVRLGVGQVAIDTLDAPPPVMDGTLFLEYDAALDRLRLSLNGFDDQFPLAVAELRTTHGFSRSLVVLGGAAEFADGLFRSTYGGDNLHLDEFVIETGGIIDTSCIADVNGSGGVDSFDLLAVLSSWNGLNGLVDIAPAPQGDGIVNVSDMLAILGAWGACP